MFSLRRFTPASTLAGATAYRVALSTSVLDLYGNALAAPFTSSFTTAAVITEGGSFTMSRAAKIHGKTAERSASASGDGILVGARNVTDYFRTVTWPST